MNYYYLAATLPMLNLKAKPPISFEEFQSACENHLSDADFAALQRIQLVFNEPSLLGENTSSHHFAREWEQREIQVRNAIAETRASRLNKEANDIRRNAQSFVFLKKKVEEAVSIDNPAEKELALDQIRWDELEQMSGYDSFSSAAVLAYAVKLMLVHRQSSFDKESGQELLEKMVNRRASENNKKESGSSASE